MARTPRKAGRPTTYTEEIGLKICERMACGESLRTISLDDGMPSLSAVFRWLSDGKHEAFREQYELARAAQADAYFADAVHIADTPVIGRKVKIDKDGNEEVTEEDMTAHRRLQIDTRKWAAGKLRPKVYGDRVAIAGDEESPLSIKAKVDLSDAPDDVLKYLAAKGKGEG